MKINQIFFIIFKELYQTELIMDFTESTLLSNFQEYIFQIETSNRNTVDIRDSIAEFVQPLNLDEKVSNIKLEGFTTNEVRKFLQYIRNQEEQWFDKIFLTWMQEVGWKIKSLDGRKYRRRIRMRAYNDEKKSYFIRTEFFRNPLYIYNSNRSVLLLENFNEDLSKGILKEAQKMEFLENFEITIFHNVMLGIVLSQGEKYFSAQSGDIDKIFQKYFKDFNDLIEFNKDIIINENTKIFKVPDKNFFLSLFPDKEIQEKNEKLLSSFVEKEIKQVYSNFPKLAYAKWHTQIDDLEHSIYETTRLVRSEKQFDLKNSFRNTRAIAEALLNLIFEISVAGEYDHNLGDKRSIGSLLELEEVKNFIKDLSPLFDSDIRYVAKICNKYAHDALIDANPSKAIEVLNRTKTLLEVLANELSKTSPLINESN